MNTTNVATAICDRTIVGTIIFYTLRPSNGLRLSGRAFQRSAPTACWAASRLRLLQPSRYSLCRRP